MKKKLLTLQLLLASALLVVFVFVPLAEAGLITGDGSWEWMSPPVQGNNINAMSFISSTTGWAAGSGGLVMKTVNSGGTWTAQTPSAFANPAYSCAGSVIGSGCNLRGVNFINANTGWTVGDQGTIWKTGDGGSTWAAQTSPSAATLRSVSFFNANVGVIVGDGVIMYTANGGTTWTAGIGTGISSTTFYSVQMLDSGTAVAVGGGGAIYRSVDAGQHWTSVGSGISKDINSVFFSDTLHGFAVGGGPGGQILRTTNGGASWDPSSSAITSILSAVTITDSGNTLIASGYDGTILRRSTPANWTDPINTVVTGMSPIASGTTNNLYAASFAPGSTSGYIGGVAGMVLASSTSGTSWTNKAGGGSTSNYSSSFIDENTGWISGENASVRKTIDAGVNWTNDNAGLPSTAFLSSVYFRSTTLGFASGYVPGTPSAGAAYKYSSGTWSEMTGLSGLNIQRLNGIRMSDDTHGYAVGKINSGSGVILRTANGSSWAADTVSATDLYDLNAVDSFSATDGWVAGQANCGPSDGCLPGQVGKGVILKYNGSSWVATYKTNVSYFSSIDMVDANVGYAVGYQQATSPVTSAGRVYKTTDGGATWTEPTAASPTSKVLASVSFFGNGTTGYAVAGNIGDGRVLKTTDGGVTWPVQAVGTNTDFNDVIVVPHAGSIGFTAFAAGGNSTVLRSVDTTTPNLEPPFDAKWSALGGAPGAASGAAQTISGGKYQNFAQGRLYWNQSQGSGVDAVHWVHGAIINKYDLMGREGGALGLPTSDEGDVTGVSGARQNTFTNGAIYWGPGVGTYGVSGAIGAKYLAGAPTGPQAYGLPTGDQQNLTLGGTSQTTQRAIITWDSTNGAHVVYGGIMWLYTVKLGGPNGPYGVATTDEIDAIGAPGGRESDFVAGNLYWSINTGTHGLQGTFLDRYKANGGPAACGLPVSDAYAAWGGYAQNMQSAYVTWRADLGGGIGRLARGGVFAKYQMLGGPGGPLHLMKEEEHSITVVDAPGAVQADFENGYVFWSSVTGSHPVNGGIYAKYSTVYGGPTGHLGLPKTDEYAIALPGGGVRQAYQHGFITWGANYGTWADFT